MLTKEELRTVFILAANAECSKWGVCQVFGSDIDRADDAIMDAGIAAVIAAVEQENEND